MTLPSTDLPSILSNAAASNHHVELVKVLLKSGADPNVQNLFAHTPLDMATDPKCRYHILFQPTTSSENTYMENHAD